ncbi:hypothetical protein N431DRAFT_437522 [Stipitochalara longipes BDJ]|nr:hypothetical protein N431DRAFT_437522 [Stipitochalara longipes BDJ]
MTDSHPSRVSLYVALYIRDGVKLPSQALDRYHWALLAIPSNESHLDAIATRFHARDYYIEENQTHWIYEEIRVPAHGTSKLLSQTYLGDVVEEERLVEILRDARVGQEKGWNCVDWVRGAVDGVWEEEVLEDGRGVGWEALQGRSLMGADEEVVRREKSVRMLL